MHRNIDRVFFVIIAILLMITGAILFNIGTAENDYITKEAEHPSANLGAATIGTDQAASGGAYIQFNDSHEIVPGDIIDLSNWKLTTPQKRSNSNEAFEIKQPELTKYSTSLYFHATPDKTGVVFKAPVDGATTSGSEYPRSELREMTSDGTQNVSWSTAAGTHVMHIKQSITQTPTVKPHIVAGQIHDMNDDVLMVRLEGKQLFVESDGENIATLTDAYELGTLFDIEFRVASNRIIVLYNGEQKLNLSRMGEGYYFKAGCYTQSNTASGDIPSSYGEVIIYELQVTHS